jgi:hypothetical protein
VAGRRTLVEGLKAKPKADRREEEAFVYGEAEESIPAKPKTAKRKAELKEQREGDGPAKPKPDPKEPRAAPTALPATNTPAATPPMPTFTGRVPITTRIRSDLATGLKRASLERQLSGETPNTVQDILEQALEPWLKEKGYLKE